MSSEKPSVRDRLLQNPILAFLSSIQFGIVLLILIGVYTSIGSGLPPVRHALEMPEAVYFRHWLMAALMALLLLSIMLSMVLRLKWSFAHWGGLVAHVGVIVLVVGGWAHFNQKVEGHVFLESPRVELQLVRGDMRLTIGSVLAKEGEEHVIDNEIFAGLKLSVVRITPGERTPVAAVDVNFSMPKRTKTISLQANAAGVPVASGLELRLVTPAAKTKFYCNDNPTLFYREVGSEEYQLAALSGLPCYRDRLLPSGHKIYDTNGRAIQSCRPQPTCDLGFAKIPTGWFELWRLPIPLPLSSWTMDVEVDGYVPFVVGMLPAADASSLGVSPAAVLSVNEGLPHALFADIPQQSRLWIDDASPVDFVWVDDPSETALWTEPLVGANELRISLESPPLEWVLPIEEGDEITLPGTLYTLTIDRLESDWPLTTGKYAGTSSPVVSLTVTTPEMSFVRTIIERFPELSMDTDLVNKYQNESLDDNLKIRLRSVSKGRVVVLAGPGVENESHAKLVVFDDAGDITSADMSLNEPTIVKSLKRPFSLAVQEIIAQAEPIDVPVVEPSSRRRHISDLRSRSAIRLHFVDSSGWECRRWVRFSMFPDDVANGVTRSTVVKLPDGRRLEFVYAGQPRELGANLFLESLTTMAFPGGQSVSSWRSDIMIDDAGVVSEGIVATNQTHAIDGWTLYQSSASEDRWRWSILGVGNRDGIRTMLVGAILITAGLVFAFFLKPMLIGEPPIAGRRGEGES